MTCRADGFESDSVAECEICTRPVRRDRIFARRKNVYCNYNGVNHDRFFFFIFSQAEKMPRRLMQFMLLKHFIELMMHSTKSLRLGCWVSLRNANWVAFNLNEMKNCDYSLGNETKFNVGCPLGTPTICLCFLIGNMTCTKQNFHNAPITRHALRHSDRVAVCIARLRFPYVNGAANQ